MPNGPTPTRHAHGGTVLRLLAVLAPAALGACAALPPGPLPLDIPDPYEATNRRVTDFNRGFNNVVVRPIAGVYQGLPPQVRAGVANGTSNLNEPVVFVNDVLQGRGRAAEITFGRFLFNSVLGIGGLFDVAALGGLPKQTGDFGQTLYVWGYQDSPYRVAPVLGPTTVRDGIGLVVDSAASPGLIAIGNYSRTAGYVIGGVSNLDRTRELRDVEETSLDPYVRLRSLWWQTRRAELLEATGQVDVQPQNLAVPTAPPPASARRTTR